MRSQVISILSMLALAFIACACSESGSTAPGGGSNVTKDSGNQIIYSSVASSQEKYIRSLQLTTGAISKYPDGLSICPYFSNYAMFGLLTNPSQQNTKVVKRYMDWYISKLNGSVNPKTGGNEIPGSIYDYIVSGGAEITAGTYDSVDSYAASFLILAQKLMEASADNIAWLKERTSSFNLVASAMVACLDTETTEVPEDFSADDNDYLSITSFNYAAKYLMDNCEVSRGLLAASKLQDAGIITDSVDYDTLYKKNLIGIEGLWAGNDYRWIDKVGLKTNWGTFYADAVAQLTPVMMGVITPESKRAKELWTKFNSNYGKWSTGYGYDAFPWTFICFAAAAMGDKDRVDEYVKHIYTYTSKNTQKENWYASEAGSLLIAIDLISNNSNF